MTQNNHGPDGGLYAVHGQYSGPPRMNSEPRLTDLDRSVSEMTSEEIEALLEERA